MANGHARCISTRVRIGADHPQTILVLPHAPGAVACSPRCDRIGSRPPSFPNFLQALNRTERPDRVDAFEPARKQVEPARVRRGEATLLPRLADLNPLPPARRKEVVARVYRLERRVATGSIIDVAM